MDSVFLISLGSALWFGILTSISPCPLATNIVAVSYISKNINSKIKSILSGIFYAIGRMVVYIVISVLIIGSLTSIPALSMFLQTKINLIIGPILIATGLILLGVIKLNFVNNNHSERAEKLIQKGPFIGSFLIGILFALAFCPISAAFFFGSMIPLSIKHNSVILIPSIYGLGTALPVVLFAILVGIGTNYVGIVFDKLTKIEVWIRRITGLVFISVGIYFIITFIIKI